MASGRCSSTSPLSRHAYLQSVIALESPSLPSEPGALFQVYDGTISNAKEEQAGNPVNAYGRSKLEAEQVIQVGDLLPAPIGTHQE